MGMGAERRRRMLGVVVKDLIDPLDDTDRLAVPGLNELIGLHHP
jgi:hypothetical protein